MSGDLHHLAMTLADADEAHADDVIALRAFIPDELAYLDALGDEPDPITDGLGSERCP